jgi:nitrate reductase (NAD(P)H)
MTSITTQTITEHDTIRLKNAHITIENISPSPGEPDIPLPPPSKNPVDILDVDKGTPDDHVPRDPRLIRLTGVHPFNVEPPLTALYKEGIGFELWRWNTS